MTRPLRQLTTAARRLTAGERAVTVGGAGPREVAEVGTALDALAGRLAQAEERQRRFLLAVSHELRTPLTAVTGYAEALADGVLPAAEVPRAGEVIRTEAARLQRRVDDLMALARLQADDFHLEPRVVDVGAVVRAAAAAWRHGRTPPARGWWWRSPAKPFSPGPTGSGCARWSTRSPTTRCACCRRARRSCSRSAASATDRRGPGRGCRCATAALASRRTTWCTPSSRGA